MKNLQTLVKSIQSAVFAVTQICISPVQLRVGWWQNCSQQWTLEFSIRSLLGLPKLIKASFQTIPKSLQLADELLGTCTWASFLSVLRIHWKFTLTLSMCFAIQAFGEHESLRTDEGL